MTTKINSQEHLNHREAFNFHSQTARSYEEQGATAALEAFIKYKKALETFVEAWDKTLAKRATYELKQAERQRQRIFACFAASVRSGKEHPDDQIKEQCLELEKMLESSEGLHTLCSLYIEKDFKQVIQEINQGDFEQTLACLGALTWLNQLKQIDEESKEVQAFHEDELLNGDLRALRKKRKQLEQAYQHFLASK